MPPLCFFSFDSLSGIDADSTADLVQGGGSLKFDEDCSTMTRKRILVVEDNSLLAQAIGTCLSNKGYDVKIFYEGADAIKYLFGEKPDLVLLDVKLPDCNGWFLARLFNKLGLAEEVPLIVISTLEPDRKKVAEARPYAYIQKPFDMAELTQLVERSLVVGSQLSEKRKNKEEAEEQNESRKS